MTFTDLVAFCSPVSVHGKEPESLGNLTQDSRKVTPGDLFIAVKGHSTDGHSFIDAAIENGASVIISEKDAPLSGDAAHVVVRNTRELIGPLAQKMAGDPADNLTVVGITGTNGKTTVATLIWQVLTALNQPVSLLGTIEKKFNQISEKSTLTTADPIEIAKDMRRMVEVGSKFLVMEVSSHALKQKRVGGISFYVSVFTNLSHDHLDYHKTTEEYAEAKKILFDTMQPIGWAISNFDDPFGEWILSDTPAKVLGISFEKHATVHADLLESSEEGNRVDIEDLRLKSPLIGSFNAFNAVQALTASTALGFDGIHVAKTLETCTGAPGRMERVNLPENLNREPAVLVDYAHTPDALKNVSRTLADLKDKSQKLFILFGCGGDRDKTKRPQMAKIAEQHGDRVIVTSDNPRTEDPEEIINDILKGFEDPASIYSNPSREEAIHKAILRASTSDIVLIAGKGHETYQEINGVRSHFDDREIALKALAARAQSTPKTRGGG